MSNTFLSIVIPMREGFGEQSEAKNLAKGEETLSSLLNLFD